MEGTYLAEFSDYTEIVGGSALIVIPEQETIEAGEKSQTLPGLQTRSSAGVVELAREVFGRDRKMVFESLLLGPEAARADVVKAVARFVGRAGHRRLVLLLAGLSDAHGHFAWGTPADDGTQPSLRLADLFAIWNKAMAVDSFKRLLVVADFPASQTWLSAVAARGNTGLYLKHFGGDPRPLHSMALTLEAMRRQYLGQPVLREGPLAGRMQRDQCFGSLAYLAQTFAVDFDGERPASTEPRTPFNRFVGFVEAESGLPHGYGQLRNPADEVVLQGVWRRGQFEQLVNSDVNEDGRYFGEYLPDGNCHLLLFQHPLPLYLAAKIPPNPTPIQKESTPHKTPPPDPLPIIITQTIDDQGCKQVTWQDPCPTESTPQIFDLLTGPAKLRIYVWFSGYYICNQYYLDRLMEGHFQNGVLNSDEPGLRVKFAAQDFQAENALADLEKSDADYEKGVFRNDILVKGEKRAYGTVYSGNFEDGKLEGFGRREMFWDCHLEEIGHWERGKLKPGSVFTRRWPNDGHQFKGVFEERKEGRVEIGRMTVVGGVVIEGTFSEKKLLEISAVFDPDGTALPNPVLYKPKLTGDFTAVRDLDVFVASFKNGKIVGEGTAYLSGKKFVGTFWELEPRKGVTVARGGQIIIT